MKIHFEKVTNAHLDIILSWLAEPHVMEFWDNTQDHKDDIINFVEGRKTPSSYAGGGYVYWIASFENESFAMLMTIQESHMEDIGQEKLSRLSKTGHTYGLDYMIGNPKFFGKGYGVKTLSTFLDFFRKSHDPKADTFIIDPSNDNPRAKHVYMKAGFKHVCDFMMEGDVSGAGKRHHLLIKKFEPTISITKATIDDYPCIQNMARFYVYDASRQLGFSLSKNGLYEPTNYQCYVKDLNKTAYMINVYDEIAGFALISTQTSQCFKMDQFFILAKFQGQGIGARVAEKIWEMHPSSWEVSVIPHNMSALRFWEKSIHDFTYGAFNKKIKKVTYDKYYPRRIIFEFDTQTSIHKNTTPQFIVRRSQFSDVDEMVLLSKTKRKLYEKAQPQFWRYAGEEGDYAQRKWFKELLKDKNYVMLTAESNAKEILAFIIGKLMQAPKVYDPGGLTLMIDDFCVISENLWHSVGSELITSLKASAKANGATQILVVCGAHDHPKRKFLMDQNLSIASEWFVGNIA